MIVKLNGSNKVDLSTIEETLAIGNVVRIVREENIHDSCGVAYPTFCKGLEIGGIPDLETIRKWLRKARKKKQPQKCKKLTEWGMATRAVRDQFVIDYDGLGTEEWTGRVNEIIYEKDGKTKNTEKFSAICQDGRPDGWIIQQIAINIHGVEVM